MKKIFLTVIFILFLGNLTYANPLQPLTVILDWFPNPDHAPLFVAQEFGFFKQEGLKVNIIGPADPNDPPKLVAVGKADIAVGYMPQLIMQVNQGLPLISIGTLIATPLNCLVVVANSNIHSITDLKGKTIGYSAPGVDSVMVKAMLEAHGLNLNDVKLINVHYDLTQALLAGKIDAATGMMRNFELIQMRLNHTPGKAFFPEENGIPSYNELIYVVNKNEINNPVLGKFLQAVTLATQYLVNHPQQTWERFAADHPLLKDQLNKQAWFATLPRFALRPAALDQSRWENYLQFLYKENLINKVLPVGSYVTTIKYS